MTRRTDTAQFLCRHCRTVMCADCQSMAEEYERLDRLNKQALYGAEQSLQQAQLRAAEAERKAEMWERIARTGMPPIIQALYDVLQVPELCRRIEAAQAKHEETK